jgi:hypothetical protein
MTFQGRIFNIEVICQMLSLMNNNFIFIAICMLVVSVSIVPEKDDRGDEISLLRDEKIK